MICFARSHLEEILTHLEGLYPNEACGVLLGKRDDDCVTVHRVVPLLNASTEGARDRYVIDPAAMLGAEREARKAGLSLVGAFHSHPDGAAGPSGIDRERAWPAYVYVIVSVREGVAAEWTCWTLDERAEAFLPEPVRLRSH